MQSRKISSFFQKADAKQFNTNDTASCHPSHCEVPNNFVPLVHVQQKSLDDGFWRVCPSFMLNRHDPAVCNMSLNASEWCSLTCSHSVATYRSSSHHKLSNGNNVGSLQANLDQLQNDCPSFNVQQLYEHYLYCNTDDKPSDSSQMVCHIPVVIDHHVIVVDHSAFSQKGWHMYSSPWTDIYSPTSSKLVLGNKSTCAQLLQWLKHWKRRHQKNNDMKSGDKWDPEYIPPNQKQYEDDSSAILLYGPHGSGKTAAVYACSKELDLKVCEVNASSTRSRTYLLQKLKEATLSHRVNPFVRGKQSDSTLFSDTVILFDEVDVVFADDYGFFQAIQEIIASTRRPVVLTCTKMPPQLQVSCHGLHFSLPSELELAVHLSVLSLVHGWPLSIHQSLHLSHYFGLDIRRAILHMQLMLSWEPANPMTPLIHELSESATKCFPSTSFGDQFPWRLSPYSHITTLSELDSTSLLDNCKCELDSMSRNVYQNFPPLHQPWIAALNPSLLDVATVSFSSTSYGQDILNILQQAYGDHHSIGENKNCRWENMAARKNVASKMFSGHWQLNWTLMATEGFPFLEMMCNFEKKKNKSGRRQSRHYFHSHMLELTDLFGN